MFERTGYGADFLFSAPEGHTASVHQLQVVYDDDFDSVLANQSACFCPKFKNGKAGGIVYIYRSVPQYFDTRHEPFPFERGQLSAFDFIAGDFASVDDETIDKLDIGHFEREDSHRRVIADIERTNAVFPIAGRAAIMMRSEFCQPEVILSMS